MRVFRIGWCLLAMILLCWPETATAKIRFSGSVANEFRVRMLQDYMPEEYDWDVGMLMSTINLQTRVYEEDRSARLLVDMDLRHDPTGVFEDDLEWRLREAYGGYYSSYVSLEVGQRIYTWGMADEFNPTDLLNPEDYRWHISMSKGQRKIGVFSGNLMLTYGNFSLQAVAVPYFEPTKLPAEGSDWLPWQLASFYQITNAFPDYVDSQRAQRPELTLGNTSYATRLRGTVGSVDLEVVYYDGYDDLPTFAVEINPDPNIIIDGGKPLMLREHYQRFQAIGGSFAFTVSKFSLRGEGAYYTPRYFMYTLDDSLLEVENILTAYEIMVDMADDEFRVRKPSWSAVGGVDFREGTQFYVNLQYVHNQILDYEDTMIDEEIEGLVTLKIQTMWLDEELEVGLDSAYNVWHDDWLAKPYVRYNLTANFSGELGAQLFGGEPETQFGDLNDNDFLYTTFKYSF